jgi:hypothetical protein
MNRYTLTLDQLLSIEKRLNSLKFRDSEIGGIVIDYFYCNSYFHSYESNLMNSLSTYASLAMDKFKIYYSEENQNWEPLSNKIVLLPSANLSKNLEFFYPLINDKNINNFCFMGRSIFPVNHRNIPFLAFTKIGYSDYQLWKVEFNKIKDKLNVIIKTLSQEFSFPAIFLYQLNRYIISQTQILSYFIELFKKYRPKLILTDHDRMKFNNCVIMAANLNNISTYTFIHGSTLPPDHYYPVLASKIFCWGEFHKRQFMNLGTPVEKLIVAGNQKINNEVKLDTDKVLEKLKLNAKPIILLATNNILLKEKLLFAQEFCHVCSLIEPDIQAVIRIHPSETKDEYNSLIRDFPFIHLLDNSDFNTDESLAISSIIVCHNTQFGFDAFMKQKNVVIFDSESVSFPIGIGAELEKFGCSLVHTESELKIVLMELIDRLDKPIKSNMVMMENFCFATGKKASLLILNQLFS